MRKVTKTNIHTKDKGKQNWVSKVPFGVCVMSGKKFTGKSAGGRCRTLGYKWAAASCLQPWRPVVLLMSACGIGRVVRHNRKW